MAYSTDVETARALACRLHAGQTDKSGAPYEQHLTRVAARLTQPEAQVVAWLHDSMEDTDVDPAELKRLFGSETCTSILAMTHHPDEDYESYVRRAGADPIARQVKISDLIDNSNLTRLPCVTLRDVQRQAKYNRALQYLLSL